MDRGRVDLLSVAITSVAVFMALFLGIAVFNDLASSPDGTAVETEANLEDAGTGTWVNVPNDGLTGDTQTVYNSRGNAVHLSGAGDSYLESNIPYTIAEDDTWTVSTQARVDPAASGVFMTAISANGRVLIQYDGPNDRWTVYYYDDGSTDSFRANVSAPNQPGNYSLISTTHNGTHLTVWRNATKGDVVNTTVSNTENIGTSSQNWVGSLEETRTFDDEWNGTLQSDLHTNPIDPIVANRTSRWMYDRGTGSTVLVFWTDTDATLSNGTWVNGLPGETMDENEGPLDVVGGNDYRWRIDGPEINAESGGRLENQPVAWIDYTSYDLSGRWSQILSDWFGLASTVPLVLLLVVVLSYLMLVRDR